MPTEGKLYKIRECNNLKEFLPNVFCIKINSDSEKNRVFLLKGSIVLYIKKIDDLTSAFLMKYRMNFYVCHIILFKNNLYIVPDNDTRFRESLKRIEFKEIPDP